jgi:hypothetical protein
MSQQTRSSRAHDGPDEPQTFADPVPNALGILDTNGEPPAFIRRQLSNLASPVACARLRAIHELGVFFSTALRELIDAAELEQVRAARRIRPKPATWSEIGLVLGVSHTQAQRRFSGRL